ncbi:hypothetical protein GOP47_0017332 [Adiantum capillus-veneris]|uniref:Uncharacterized protein n=1 Tax=Adiantum capillus-veneris TaxID=13818 RepID=A0A9D4Z9L6_ADICA|nr:hypothetical protein GOP47_0017332 [Adiantum capillus-veneris]
MGAAEKGIVIELLAIMCSQSKPSAVYASPPYPILLCVSASAKLAWLSTWLLSPSTLELVATAPP